MKRYTLKYLGLICTVLLVACQNQIFSEEEDLMQSASLTLKIKTAATQASSRGIEDLNDDGTTSELEEVIDGRRMYNLAVALVDNNGTVISSQELKQGDSRFSNENKEATVTFERLNYGTTYQLLAVANYGSYDTNTTGNLTNVNNLIETINVTADETSKLCPVSTPYPLSLKKEIVLQPGSNTVSGELVRTYARLRINVRNQSKSKDLKINDLDFGEKFTRERVDLFESGGEATVSPVVTSEHAITPFVNPTIIAKVADDGKVTEQTIFDAYLLESEGGDYTYKLSLEYEGVEETVYTVSSSSSTSIENEGLYVISHTTGSGWNSTTRYLYANGDVVSASTNYSTNGAVNPNYVWQFTKTGNGNNYTIESMGSSGYYMQSSGVTNSSVPLVAEKGDDDYFTFSKQQWNNYWTLKSTNDNLYLSMDDGTVEGNNNNGSNFRLYKVTSTTQTTNVTKEADIPITVVNKETGEATPITAIKRNDFINILVNVNYNEKSGQFWFEVTDWDSKTGEVTFD